MLTIFGQPHRNGGFCDGISRRDFLTIGGSLLGGLALPQLLTAESRSGIKQSHKGLINVFLPGGPPHIDMWDLKPNAPEEIRGEFKPIKTKVAGIDICEHFPRIAGMMDKFAIIRSLVGSVDVHDAYQCMTGHKKEKDTEAFWPSLGAWVSKVQGPVNNAVPPHLSLMYKTQEGRWGYPGGGGFLGMGHAPFRLVEGMDERTKAVSNRVPHLVLQGVTLERLQNRTQVLKALDTLNRSCDQRGAMDGLDAHTQKAYGILTSSKLSEALDLSKEPTKLLDRYGVNDPAFQLDGAPRMVRNLCLARRLVEAGARVVTLNFSRWDWHGVHDSQGNFASGRKDMPMLDQAVSALVTDLHERGLDQEVSVLVWGEFGRTPRIDKKNDGRGHWGTLSCALLAGGGMRTGQVIGASDKQAAQATDRPVTHQNIFATLYTNLGINVSQTTVTEPGGRPLYLVDPEHEPLRELS